MNRLLYAACFAVGLLAIGETKDVSLYRSVKPNLSAAEQRTIEDGFRAVTSQRVTVAIQTTPAMAGRRLARTTLGTIWRRGCPA